MPHGRVQGLTSTVWGPICCLSTLAGLVIGHTKSPTTQDITSLGPISTKARLSCPDNEDCAVAAAAIGSLVAGFILGLVVMFVVQRCLKSRKQTLPPKDYDIRQSSHLDENRNNDGADLYSVHPEVTANQPLFKGHKKLERLVKKPPTSPGTTVAVTPLLPKVGPTPAAGPATTTEAELPAPDSDVLYTNVGATSQLFQPYEALDIIAEESEYENKNITQAAASKGSN